MNSIEHNSIDGTQKNEWAEKFVRYILMFIKIILKLLFSIVRLLILIVIRLSKKLNDFLKPYFERIEAMLYSRAREFFGL